MRIGIDARLYSQTGVGRYIRSIISELSTLDNKNEYIIYLNSNESSLINIKNNKWTKKVINLEWHSLKEQFVMPGILNDDRLDIVHFPYFNVPVFYTGKYILTIHDLIIDHFDTGKASTRAYPLYKLKRFGYKISMTRAIHAAKALIAISQTTKDEIIDHYRVDADSINITYDALDGSFRKIADTRTPLKLFSSPYVLYVGNAYPHKNLNRLIDSFSMISKTKHYSLVLAGDDPYFYPRLQQYVRRKRMDSEIIFFGYANDSQLFDLYSYCSCLVFPSLMEGFGIPNLEAVYCNKLPVISDIPVFREIWGNDVEYFDPENTSQMAAKILSVLSLSKTEYSRKVALGKRHLSGYHWRKTAEKTLAIYNKVFRSS